MIFLGWLEKVMIELVATAIITVSSTLLFGYWFRYTCLLILSAKTTRDYAAEVATANQLSFLQVQRQLRETAIADLDGLQAALNRDYALLTYLIQHGGTSETSMEDRMLRIDYQVMSAWCRFSRSFSPAAARQALDEMSQVVAHFANAMGERATCAAAA
jgi:hypothetical protein